MATIRITNLSLRAIIGIHDWERKHKQDIIINVTIDFDETHAAQSDNIDDTVDYKTITKNIIKFAENSECYLLEKLTDQILNIVMENQKIDAATVQIDKPHALRFAESVSMELHRKRER